jgi:hypothetical protein
LVFKRVTALKSLQWIHPLGHQEKLAYECPQFADPTHEPAAGKFLISFIAALN